MPLLFKVVRGADELDDISGCDWVILALSLGDVPRCSPVLGVSSTLPFFAGLLFVVFAGLLFVFVGDFDFIGVCDKKN